VFGNYPLLDLKAMTAMVDSHLSSGAEYTYNDHHEGVPWGMGCEVISRSTLKSLLNLDLTAEQKEIGTLYIRQNVGKFSMNRWASRHADPNIKLAFETQQDLGLLRDIIDHVPDPDAPSVLAYLAEHPLLAASNVESPPREVGMEKLYLHPDKVAALRRSDQTQPDPTYPISVELSLTNRCNLACVYCSDRDLRERESLVSELDKDTLFRLFDDLKEGGAQGIVLEGGGEPTIHPNFGAIVHRLASIDLPAGLITNGTRPLSPETVSSLEWIRVSVDASSPTEWAALKRQDRFAQVLSNLREYARHCPTVGVGYVVTNANMSDIETFVLRIRQHGVSYVQFRPVVDAPDLAPTDDALRYLCRYETNTFAVLIDDMQANLPRSNAGLPCRAHSVTTVISGDGNVFLCGRLNIHPWIRPIGNVRHTPFREIWFGEERAKHGRQVLDPSFCAKHCPQCRLTKFNRLLDRLDRTRTQHFI
jgi:MoaA/NifB/PqqE/SkfB family radical SAM enzyme